MRVLATLVCFCLAMQGCASNSPSRSSIGAQALQDGNYFTAESNMRSAIQAGEHPDINWFNLGLLYYRQSKQAAATQSVMLQKAESAFTISARYGYVEAQNLLRVWGKPVPPVDLVQPKSNSSDLAAILLLGAAAVATKGATSPQQPLSRTSASCTSTLVGASTVHTDCF